VSRAAERATNRDIRQWARSREYPIQDTGRIPPELREQYELDRESLIEERAASEHAADAMAARRAGEVGDDELARLEVVSRETLPEQPRKRRLWDRERSARSVGRHKRQTLEGIGQFAWGGLAQVAGMSGQVPLARVLEMQAPVAGAVIEDLAAGTLVDKILQPFARVGAKGDVLMALFGPPVLVTAITRQPALYPMLRPYLIDALESWYLIAGPKIKAREKRREKLKAELDGVSLDDIVDALFAPVAEATREPAAA
jgi:hypothetical protein